VIRLYPQLASLLRLTSSSSSTLPLINLLTEGQSLFHSFTDRIAQLLNYL
jgi:hypothetical protein